MQLLVCGDLHIRDSTPAMRRESNFLKEVCLPKLKFLVDTANERYANLVIAGDIFDSPEVSYEAFNLTMKILFDAELTVFAVSGQHDMNFHSQNLIDTPYWGLVVSGAITNLYPNTHGISGAGFGVEPELKNEEFLVTHFCITEKEPPFFLKDALSAEDFLKKYPGYKYIISGDYHVAHTTEFNNRYLINTGPMYRKEKTQLNMKPCAFFIDNDEEICECIHIPIKPANESFDLDKIEKSKQIGLSQNIDMDLSSLKEMVLGNDQKSSQFNNEDIQFKDIVSLICSKYKLNPGQLLPIDKLENIMQRAKE